MFLAETGEEELLEMLAEISVIITDSHKAVLDNVGHNQFVFVRLYARLLLFFLTLTCPDRAMDCFSFAAENRGGCCPRSGHAS